MRGQNGGNTPFHFCSSLCLLVATAYECECSKCEPQFACYAKSDSMRRKKRRARKQELAPVRDRHVAWQIDRKYRTAKHKRQNSSAASTHSAYTVDSGATISVTNSISCLKYITDACPNRKVQVANKQYVDIVCIGVAELNLVDDAGQQYTILLENVAYSPHFSGNLLSVEELFKQHKIATIFRGPNAAFITPDGRNIPFSTDARRRYMLHAHSVLDDNKPELWHKRLMHAGTAAMQRLGQFIPCLQRRDYNFSDCDACAQGGGRKSNAFSAQRSFEKRPRKQNNFTYFGERIASDLCGPMPDSIGGEKYFIIFHDSYSKYLAAYAIKDKSKETVLDAFRLFLSDHDRLLTRGIGTFWTDNGGEYLNSDMDAFCEEMCIKRSYTVPYTPSQNPYAERANGTLLRPLRSIIASSPESHEKLWVPLLEQAAIVHNALLGPDGISPYERVHGKPFDYKLLHAPLSLCWYLVPERERASKLSPRALPAVYLGMDPQRHGHRVYVPSLRRYTTALHVVFNEHRFYHSSLDQRRVHFDDNYQQHDNDTIGTRMRDRSGTYREERDDTNDPTVDDQQHDPYDSRHFTINDDRDITPTPAGTRLRDDLRHGTADDYHENHCSNPSCLYPSGHDGPCSDIEEAGRRNRIRRPPVRFGFGAQTCQVDGCVFHNMHCGECENQSGSKLPNFPDSLYSALDDASSVLDIDLLEQPLRVVIDDVQHEILTVDMSDFGKVPPPKTYEDTQRSPLKPKWDDSMQEEHTTLMENKTWTYVSRNDPRVRRRKPTKSRWVYTIKYNRDGTISRWKSRFVVCGYSQRHGYDYDRAFSATLRASSFRTLLAISAGKGMRLMHFDVKNAFTEANMDNHDVFVEPAKGFEVWEWINGKKQSMLLHLQRALYGTKQASRLWQETLRDHLVEQGFKQSTADPCLYRLSSDDGEILLGIYVDDVIVAYRGDALYSKFTDAFFKRFRGKSEKLSWFLGMAIDQHEDYSIHLDHERSISNCADKYIPNNKVTRDHPPDVLFSKLARATDDVERAQVQRFGYASIVGAILYIAVMSRPDVAWHASILAKFMSDPSSDCCDAAVQLLQYLHSTRKKRMFFPGTVNVPDGLSKHSKDIESNHGFVAYSDSSWGNSTPYPMFGFGIYMYGGLVSFASKQLKTVAFSSCEAEYAAASYTCKEIEFIRNICDDMGVTLQGRLVLAVDNTAAIDIAHDVGVSGRTKHFDRAIHYLRDLTQLRRVLPAHVTTDQQRADGYTKPLTKHAYAKWVPHVVH